MDRNTFICRESVGYDNQIMIMMIPFHVYNEFAILKNVFKVIKKLSYEILHPIYINMC